jgi:hypothetical protein
VISGNLANFLELNACDHSSFLKMVIHNSFLTDPFFAVCFSDELRNPTLQNIFPSHCREQIESNLPARRFVSATIRQK